MHNRSRLRWARASIIQVTETRHVAGSCARGLRMLIFLNRNYEVRVLRKASQPQKRCGHLCGNSPYLVASRGQSSSSGHRSAACRPQRKLPILFALDGCIRSTTLNGIVLPLLLFPPLGIIETLGLTPIHEGVVREGGPAPESSHVMNAELLHGGGLVHHHRRSRHTGATEEQWGLVYCEAS